MTWRGRYVFVGGLHRSGTSLVSRILASHPEVAAIEDAPVPEQEGVFLQGAIPHTAQHGIPGAFAFDAEQHLTETSRFNTLETKVRLRDDWEEWFSPGGAWRVEKSPVNLLRMRLYQALFPTAHFVIVTRHPVAVAQATGKWTDASIADLVRHWGHAHDLALEDLKYLHCALVIRYEDLCVAPEREIARLHAFLSLPSREFPDPIRNGNLDYASMSDIALPPCAKALGYGPNIHSQAPVETGVSFRHYLSDVRRLHENACRAAASAQHNSM